MPTQQQLDDLLAWGKSHKCQVNSKLNFVVGDNGSTVIAAEIIGSGEELISCDATAIIGPATVTKAFGEIEKEFLRVAIKFSLLHEWINKETSSFKEYLATLPSGDEIGTPLYYDDQELKWLKGTNLGADIPTRRERVVEEYAQGIEKLKLDSAKYTLNDYFWVYTIFNSRSFPARLVYPELDESVAILLPIIDALNHRPLEPVTWDTMHGACFRIVTGKEVQKGEEIFNNYGAKGNEELLTGYGFALKDNQFDTVALKLGNISEELIKGVENVPENLTFYLSDSQLIPGPLREIFERVAKVNRGYEDPHLVTAAGLATLKTLLSAKYTKLKEHSDGLSTPSTQRQRFMRIYIDGQLRVYVAALKRIDIVIGSIRAKMDAFDINSIDAATLDEFKKLCGVESTDELVSLDIEEEIILIALCQLHGTDSAKVSQWPQNSSNDPEAYDELYSNMVSPLIAAAPQTFNRHHLTTAKLACAGDVLYSRGYDWQDEHGRKRYSVLLKVDSQ